MRTRGFKPKVDAVRRMKLSGSSTDRGGHEVRTTHEIHENIEKPQKSQSGRPGYLRIHIGTPPR